MGFGARVKRERERQGLNQAELAKKAGLPDDSGQQTISILEKRDSSKSKFAQAIADALGVDVTFLLTGKVSEAPAYRLPDRLARMMSLIPRDAQQRIERLIEAYLTGDDLRPRRLHAVAAGKK